jgi:probable F420-dependent oxidoreductase
VKIGFGLISCQRYPGDPRSDAELYREALELAELAERLGFDSVWVSEHHFLDDGYMSSLLPVCAAIAARTERIEIGTGVLLAPLHHPLRLAEDAATVDLISGGRLILGLGLGWREEEFEGLGVPMAERGRRLRTAIQTLREAWSDGLAEPGVSVTPKPPRPGGPPIWIGGSAEAAVRRAGRIADGFMATRASPEIFGRQVEWLREELEAAGRDPASFTFAVHAPVFPWHGPDAWERVREHYHYVMWKYADMAGARARTGPPPAPPALTREREEELRRTISFGPPAEVAEQIAAYREAAAGEIHFVARLYWPGMDPAVQREALEIFAAEVIPALR